MDDVDEGVHGAAVGQEIVDEQHPLAGVQELFGHEDIIGTLALGEGLDLADVHVPGDVLGLVFLGKDHGGVAKGRGGQASNANARSLDGQDPVHGTSLESLPERLADGLEKRHIHLVVQEAVDLQYLVAAPYFSVPQDPLL